MFLDQPRLKEALEILSRDRQSESIVTTALQAASAVWFAKAGRHDEAAKQYDLFLKSADSGTNEWFSGPSANRLAISLFRVHRDEDAKSLLNAVLHHFQLESSIPPDSMRESIECLTNIIRTTSSDAAALAIRAQLFDAINDPKSQLEDLTRLVELRPDDRDIRIKQARLLAKSGIYAKARQAFEWLADHEPENPDWQLRASSLGPDVIAYWAFESGTEGWKPSAGDAQVYTVDGSLVINTSGAYPSAITSVAIDADEFVFCLRLRNDQQVNLILGAKSNSETAKEVVSSQTVTPSKDWQEVEFDIQSKEQINRLRILVEGSLPGHRIEIQSIRIRKKSDSVN
jgi:tetratricopeptide (TPR) repeat protein